jgi:hypothetical protein
MSTTPLDASTTTTSTATENGVPFDAHGIEQIPDSSRDCSPWELFWIWSGANIAPINWVLGALGITLGLSLVETLVVVVLGKRRSRRPVLPFDPTRSVRQRVIEICFVTADYHRTMEGLVRPAVSRPRATRPRTARLTATTGRAAIPAVARR